MVAPRAANGVLLTGVYGVGKSTVAADLGDVLEHWRVPYASIDLDWLMWFDTGRDDMESLGDEVFLANLHAVVGNYLGVGIERFVLAGAVESAADVTAMRGALGFPLTVVRLAVPMTVVTRRLRTDPTVGRQEDLRVATEWTEASVGFGVEDWAVGNERTVRETTMEILDRLGWIA